MTDSALAVEPFDPHSAAEPELRSLHELKVVLDAERLPDDPPTPYESVLDDLLNVPAHRRARYWVVRDGGATLGYGSASFDDVQDNRHIIEVEGGVHPDARRRGIASMLLERAVEVAREEGRTILDGWAVVDSPGEAFLVAAGGERRYVERMSRMRIEDLDESLMKDWVARAADRAEGYSLVAWDGPAPEEHLEGYAQVLHVMNTAPLEDLDWEDEVWTPERVRANEEALAAGGHEWWVVVARHDASRAFAGLTELYFPKHRPWAGIQGNTGVDPAHRDRGLGRWLKATNILRMRAEHPEVRWVDTWNAGTNRPMLNINEQMGFRPELYLAGVQVPTEKAAAFLDARTK